MKKSKAGSKRVLFIDRDGTLIKEAPPSYQIDSFSKLEFYPNVFRYMRRIASLDYELVMVSNQDGLGTEQFPETSFQPVHDFVIRAFENEGIVFKEVLIDRTHVSEQNPSRKPGVGMMGKYLNDKKYDLRNSYVIGDRITDMQFAKNLSCKGIWLKNSESLGANEIADPTALNETIVLATNKWKDIYSELKVAVTRKARKRK